MTSINHYNNLCLVRYGNGQDGEGLTKLSEALKKLIEEAIDKAEKSLQSEKEKLSCPFKYSDKETNCEFYQRLIGECDKPENKNTANGFEKSQLEQWKKDCVDSHSRRYDDATKRALEDIDSKLISLGELAGQLGGFVGESESAKKAVEKAKECLEKRIKKCENCQKHLPNSDNCQDPSNCQSIQQKIDELKKQETAIKSNVNNPHDLLNNLCSALEKFLGFNSASKGYTGTGIVYSDLDRLCDGVMGFLSGVLSNIKEHLGQHKETITDAIKILKQNKHAGKKGFNEAIAQVVAGVGRYNERVRESNEKVSEPIKKLQREMNQIKNEMKEILQDNDDVMSKVEEAKNRVDAECSQYVRFVSEFGTKLTTKENELKVISDLNDQCKNNVNNARDVINRENERLQRTWQNQRSDLENINKKVERELKRLNDDVNEKNKAEVEKLLKGIKDNITAFKDRIENGPMRELSHWIELRKDEITAGRDKVYTDIKTFSSQYSVLHPELEAIKGIVQDSDKPKKLGDLVDDIPLAVTSVGSQLNIHIQSLNRWRMTAQAAVKVAMERVDEIVKLLNGKESSQLKTKKDAVTDAATALEQKAQTLMSAIDAAGEALGATVGMANQSVTAMEGVLKADLGRLKKNIRQTLQAYVLKLGAAINKGIGDASGSGPPRPGYMALMNSLKSSDGSDHDTEIGKEMAKFGVANADAAKSIEIVLYYIGQAHHHWKTITKNLTEPFTKDLQNTVEALGKNENADNVVLQQLTGYDGSGTGSKNALSKAVTKIQQDVNNKLNGIMYPARNGKKISKHTISNAHSDFAGAFRAFNNAIEKLVKDGGLITSDKTTIDYQLKTLNSMIGDSSSTFYATVTDLKNIHSDLSNINTEELSTTKGKINDAIHKVKEQVEYIKKHSSQTNEPDRKLMKTVASLPEYMKFLNESITKVIALVVRANHDLSKWIEEVSKYTVQIDATREQYVNDLKTYVDGSVSFSKDILLTGIKKQYVRSIKRLLDDAIAAVIDVLKPLPDMVEKDKHIGFKGLMKTLEDGNIVPGAQHTNIEKLTEVKNANSDTGDEKKQTFMKLSENFKYFAEPLFLYLSKEAQRVHSEYNATKNPRGTDVQQYSDHISKIHDAFNILLDDLNNKHRYDHKVHNLLDNLSDAVSLLVPKGFAMPNSPVIDGLTAGLKRFVGELEKVYISAYDGQKCELIRNFKTVVEYNNVYNTYEVTDEGRDCAKVCLSVIPIVHHELTELNNKLDETDVEWKDYKIYNSSQPDQSLHKLFFGDNGYDVGLSHDAKHGELNHKDGYNGKCIFDILNNKTYELFESNKQPLSLAAPGVGDSEEPEVDMVDYGHIPKLYHYLENYFGVCHLIGHAKPRHPCSVYEMLCWLTGLPHNTAYKKLKEHIGSLFLVADKDNPSKKIPKPILTSHSSITTSNVLTAVEEICATSYAVLTAIVGTGDAATHYACELPNNSSRLIYPTNGADCLDTLLDILRRIFPVLQFLHAQCRLKTKHYGWYNCEYGRDIRPTKWPCNEHTKESTKVPTKEPTKCLPKSPLQSYLNDCLPGHLPHQLSSIGCKAECNTCPKKPDGRPCLTPMGFRGFSGSTKTGKDLCSVLSKFFNIPQVNSLVCLIPKPPSTLSEHFGFALSLVEGWHTWRASGSVNPLQAAIENHISEVSMDLVKRGTISNALRDAYGSSREKHLKHVNDSPDLCSLSMNMTCPGRDANCAPYIYTLCTDSYDYLVYKNCNLYLSWAIYLPWTFWDLLNNLYTAFCSINCQDWGCRGGLRGDKCKKGSHGVVDEEKKSAICQCPSIVDCKGVAPTLYQFGFVFGEASTLNDSQSPKKCSDFCSQLKKVLESEYFKKLFAECDNFLYYIRFPFMTLTLALWLLSLLYLLHIMVIRLDLLHIKSHLHTPSSHRIAAQSLLAAARVNKLNRVFYLQP